MDLFSNKKTTNIGAKTWNKLNKERLIKLTNFVVRAYFFLILPQKHANDILHFPFSIIIPSFCYYAKSNHQQLQKEVLLFYHAQILAEIAIKASSSRSDKVDLMTFKSKIFFGVVFEASSVRP